MYIEGMKTFTTIIETERLILRPHTMDDVEPSYQMNLDEEVSRYTGDGGVQTREAIHRRIKENVLGDYAKYGFGRFAVILKSENKFLGFSGLKYLPDLDSVDLGYRLRKDYWGKGYATESARASLDFGFNELKLPKIIALALPGNKASTHVMDKLGFEYDKMVVDEGIEAMQYVKFRQD